jgi:hypothetical protein
VAAIVDFLIRPLIGRRTYWFSLPILAVIGVLGWLLFQWSYALGDVVPLRLSGMAITVVAVVLALWVVGRRMKDTGRFWILWFLGMGAAARLAEATVRWAGGSWEQGQAAFGLVIVLVLVALGLVPSWRPAAPGANEDEIEDEDLEDEGAEAGVSP